MLFIEILYYQKKTKNNPMSKTKTLFEKIMVCAMKEYYEIIKGRKGGL